MENHSCFNSGGDMKKLMSFMRVLHDFVDKNKTDIDLNTASNITTNFLTVFSHLINQNTAWNNLTNSEKTETASQLLLHIQHTSFTLSCKLDNVNQTHEISIENLIMKAFFMNTSYESLFEKNGSSIRIPPGMNVNRDNQCSNSANGAIIKQLGNYLFGDLSNQQQINTETLAFSIADTNETHQINNGSKVRIR